MLLALGNQHKGNRNEIPFPAGLLGDFISRHCRIVLCHYIANLAVKLRSHIANYLNGVVAGKYYFGICHSFKAMFLNSWLILKRVTPRNADKEQENGIP